MKKLLFIFNPNAGKGKINTNLLNILQILSSKYHVTTYPTKARKDAYDYLLCNQQMYDVIACAGGDGTLNEVVSAMIKNDLHMPLGYIPGGTMNDWATNTGIPLDMIEAAKVIVEGKPTFFDIGRFNGRITFNYVAAFGAFTDISYATPQSLKKVIGQTAYGVTAIKSLIGLRPYSLRVLYDDGKELSGKYMFGMASNSKVVGGFKLTGMYADLHDGLFEIVLIKEMKNPLDFNRLFGAALMQNYMNNKVIDIVEAKKAKFIFEEPIKWTLDGEFGGCCKSAEIEILHNAIEFIIRDEEPIIQNTKLLKD